MEQASTDTGIAKVPQDFYELLGVNADADAEAKLCCERR